MNIIQIWHLGECNINFYCTQKNDIARGACAEFNIIFQSAIKIDIDTKPKCHICFIICLLLIQIKYLTNLKNYASQYQFCKVVMWPWSDQSQQRMSSRHVIIWNILCIFNIQDFKWARQPDEQHCYQCVVILLIQCVFFCNILTINWKM